MVKSTDPKKLEEYASTVSQIEQQYINTEFRVQDIEFEILSTIRYDPLLTECIDPNIFESTPDNFKLFFLFDEHFHRLNFTLAYFEFGFEITRDELLLKLNEVISGLDKSNSYRLRLTVNKEGEVKITAQLTAQRYNLFDGFNTLENYTSPLWNVYIDTQPIPISPFTSFKTTKRDRYTEARERILLPGAEGPQEVLLFNTAIQVTEGSITNLAFKATDQKTGEELWVTPPLASGCLCGVVRHLLLTKGLISERQVNLKDVKIGDEVLLFNGLQGVVKGIIRERP